MSTTNIGPVSQDEISRLYAEKGELVTQLEIAQSKLQQVNLRLSQILNIGQNQPIQPK